MKVLVVGGGGREHALAWKCASSNRVHQVFVAPGNAGTAAEAKVINVDVAADDIDGLLQFAIGEDIDLTIVGPEGPWSAASPIASATPVGAASAPPPSPRASRVQKPSPRIFSAVIAYRPRASPRLRRRISMSAMFSHSACRWWLKPTDWPPARAWSFAKPTNPH